MAIPDRRGRKGRRYGLASVSALAVAAMLAGAVGFRPRLRSCSGWSGRRVTRHWLIENRPHWRRDVILREDHGTLRSGTGPRAVAALRNTMLAIVHDSAEPLTEIFAENGLDAIAAAQRGFL